MKLDDMKFISSLDKSNMFAQIASFPTQITDAMQLINDTSLLKIYNIHQIIITGMGGSAISGDILEKYLLHKLNIPIHVNRTYDLPKWATKKTLVIAQSYSGNTGETLAALKNANEKKCSIIGISSGGLLKEYCQKHSLPYIQIPEGYQPRSALGFLFFSSILALHKTGLLSTVIQPEIDESISVTKELIEQVNPNIAFDNNAAKQIANQIDHTMPIIYAWNYYAPIAKRWATQFNENSKVISKYGCIPEKIHNEIVGWAEHTEYAKYFSGILLRDKKIETLQIKTTFDFVYKLFDQTLGKVVEINVMGKSPLAKLMYLLVLGDYISCYYALLRNKDPTPISIINQCKDELSKL